MSRLTDRVQSLVDKYGEDFTVGGVTHRGIFSNITIGNARAYLTSAQIDASSLPLWACLVTQADSAIVGDTLDWDGLSLVVQKIAKARYQGTVCAKMLVLTG